MTPLERRLLLVLRLGQIPMCDRCAARVLDADPTEVRQAMATLERRREIKRERACRCGEGGIVLGVRQEEIAA